MNRVLAAIIVTLVMITPTFENAVYAAPLTQPALCKEFVSSSFEDSDSKLAKSSCDAFPTTDSTQENSYEPYLNLATALKRMDRITDALSIFEQALRVEGMTPLAKHNIYTNIALTHRNSGNLEGAIEAFQNARKLVVAPLFKAIVNQDIGQLCLQMARWLCVIEVTTETMSLGLSEESQLLHVAYEMRGVAHGLIGQKEKSDGDFQKYVKLSPDKKLAESRIEAHREKIAEMRMQLE